MQTFSTNEVAKAVGIHRITLQRWLDHGWIKPSIEVPLKNRTMWRWTTADVEKARRFKGTLKTGPKPRQKKGKSKN
jgi:predicted site-specific integrase-resolvase